MLEIVFAYPNREPFSRKASLLKNSSFPHESSMSLDGFLSKFPSTRASNLEERFDLLLKKFMLREEALEGSDFKQQTPVIKNP